MGDAAAVYSRLHHVRKALHHEDEEASRGKEGGGCYTLPSGVIPLCVLNQGPADPLVTQETQVDEMQAQAIQVDGKSMSWSVVMIESQLTKVEVEENMTFCCVCIGRSNARSLG